jgi:hypothetical protein
VTIVRRLARLALVAAIAASAPALLCASIGGAGPATPVCVNAAAQNHAAIVIEHADGTVRTTCVGFDATQLNGKQLLDASLIPYGVSSDPNYGDAVCSVDGEPTSYPPNCFTLPSYWALTRASYGGPWMVANKGIGGLLFVDGDAMGLRYVPSSSQPEAPARSPAGICPPPQPKPTPSSTTSPIAVPSAGAGASPGHAATGNPAPVGAAVSPVPSGAVDTPTGIPTMPAPAASSTANPSRAAHKVAATGAFKPSLGWVATAAAALAMVGLLAVQLLAGRPGA